MKKYLLLLAFLLGSNVIAFSQIITIKEISINDKIVLLDAKIKSKLDSILSDTDIPYSALHFLGTSWYKIKFHPSINVIELRGINGKLDSIYEVKLQKKDFLNLLPFNYDTVDEVLIKVCIDYDDDPSKSNFLSSRRVFALPLETYGSNVNDINCSVLTKLFSGHFSKKEYRQVKGYNGLKKESKIVAKYKDTINGHIISAIPLSKDSSLLFTLKREGCLDPDIYTEYLLVKDSIIILSKFQLYDCPIRELSKSISIAMVQNNNKKYIKQSSNSLCFFEFRTIVDCYHDWSYRKVIEIENIGNCVGLIKSDAVIYKVNHNRAIYQFNADHKYERINLDEHPEQGFYGFVEAKSENGYKIYIGGWIE